MAKKPWLSGNTKPEVGVPVPGSSDRQMAGTRFEAYVRDAMREAGDMTLAQLARDSGIKETNWHTWFRGEHRPRANTLRLATPVLKRTPEQMLASWDGTKPHKPLGRPETPDELVAALRDQTRAIDGLVAALGRMAEQAEGERRANAAASALQAAEGNVSRARRPAPPSSAGSGR